MTNAHGSRPGFWRNHGVTTATVLASVIAALSTVAIGLGTSTSNERQATQQNFNAAVEAIGGTGAAERAGGVSLAASLASQKVEQAKNPSILTRVTLTKADLSNTDLSGADLTGAVVDGANFDGAKIDGTTNLTGLRGSALNLRTGRQGSGVPLPYQRGC